MNLHVDRRGNGEPLLFIHGWGMHGGMWGGVLERLAQRCRVLAVDLPGHGYSGRIEDSGFWTQGAEKMRNREEGRGKGKTVSLNPSPLSTEGAIPSPFSLDRVVDALSARFSEPLTVCGWSLGGAIALRWAMRFPQQVDRLVLVSSTPCFVRQPGWNCAMAADTLSGFYDALQQDYASTLRRFLALQVRGSEQERELLLTLRRSLSSRDEPDRATLQACLDILRDCDLRAALPDIFQKTLVIAGERDALTPLAASQYMARQLPMGRIVEIAGAAHAPFLSHPEDFVTHVVGFLDE